MSSEKHYILPFRERSHRLFDFLTSLPDWVHYLTSLTAVGFSTVLLLQLQHFVSVMDGRHSQPVVALFFIAIAFSTVMGGVRAGLFAVLLSLFSTVYFLIPPVGLQVHLTMANYVTLFIVVSVGSLIALGMEAYRNNTRLLFENLALLSVEQARADQEMVLNKIAQAVRTARSPEYVQSVAVSSVGQLLDVDRCYFVNYSTHGKSRTVGQHWHRDGHIEPNVPFRASDFRFDGQSSYADDQTVVIDDAESQLPSGVSLELLRKLGVRSAIFVPIVADGQSEASLVVAMNDTPRAWEHNEITLVEAVALQTRAAVDAARIQQKEHNIAIQLQAALQPSLSLNIDGLSVASFYRAALDEANVGGDFYDAFTLPDGHITFVVGDVSGKGLVAASQVAAIRHMLRCLLQTMPTLVGAVEQLNDVLMGQQLLPSFATLFVGVLNPTDLVIEYVSCGHEPGLILRRTHKPDVLQLPTTGPIIGVFEHAKSGSGDSWFTSSRHQMQPGDTLVLYTDGVCDAGVDVTNMLGVDGLIKELIEYSTDKQRFSIGTSEISAPDLLSYCVIATEDFAKGVLRDDICLLAIAISQNYSVEAHFAGIPKAPGRSQLIHIAEHAANMTELKKDLVADVLKLATHGKLQIVNSTSDLPAPLLNRDETVSLDAGENVRELRRSVRNVGASAGLLGDAVDSLEMAAGEAANNSLVHAVKGFGYVSWNNDGCVQVRIEDRGRGIPYDELPRATLERGYTTAGTLGQGFWIILQSVKCCWIATNEHGTVVVLEHNNYEPPAESFSVSAVF
jgi:serine phosphatase RsbU (regulator of sigma subunit)/anti-sigma regulatory factor (Ser/Thr protein kinase)